jgi:hypothetical protein
MKTETIVSLLCEELFVPLSQNFEPVGGLLLGQSAQGGWGGHFAPRASRFDLAGAPAAGFTNIWIIAFYDFTDW